MSEKKKPVRHPSTERMFREAAEKFMTLRRQHRRASDAMWAGTLALWFTREELVLIDAYLCPNDLAMLRRMGRSPR